MNSEQTTTTKSGTTSPDSRKPRLWLRIILWLLLALFVAAAGIIFYAYSQVPELNMDAFTYDENAQILDVNGQAYQYLQGTELRQNVSITDIPPVLRSAFISIEDQRFYGHNGVDIRGIARAALGVVTSGSLEGAGGSTITQQLIKLTQLTSDKTITRKFSEWVLAVRLEKVWSKDQILEAYLNKINLSGVYGVKEAARQYFNEDLTQITAAQSAILAAIANSPSYYDPYTYDASGEIVTDASGIVLNPNNKERAGLVLNKMLELGYLNQQEYDEACADLDSGAGLTYVDLTETYSYFTDAVYSQLLSDLSDRYGYTDEEADAYIQKAGLKVYSTVDPAVQSVLEEESKNDSLFPRQSSAAAQASELTGVSYIPQVGMTVIDNKTGAVAGMVGGREDKTNLSMNRAERSFQTGSSTKPLTAYGPALDTKKVTLATVYNDVAIDWNGWRPNNADYTFTGPMSVRDGLAKSVNTIAAQVLAETGIDVSASYAQKLGLTVSDSDKSGGAALALGGYSEGQTPLAMAAAFAVFPNGGSYTKPYLYTKVVDSAGNVVLENQHKTQNVFSEDTCFLITDTLKQAIQGETTTISVSGTEAAGKTGTTDGNMHAWFCGYTPDYSMAVWYGYDENVVSTSEGDIELNIGISGGSMPGPAMMFEEVMNRLPVTKSTFDRPSDIVRVEVDSASGKLPGTLTDQDPRGSTRVQEYFAAGTAPTAKDDVHVLADIDTASGMLKNTTCPAAQTGQGVYLDLSKISYPTGIVPVDSTYVPGSLTNYALSTAPRCTLHQ